MTHLWHTAEAGRHVLPGLGHLDEFRWWVRGHLQDVPATDLTGESIRPMDSPLPGSTPGGNGHGQLAGLAAADPLSSVAEVERWCPDPDARFLIVDDCKLNRENLAAIFA